MQFSSKIFFCIEDSFGSTVSPDRFDLPRELHERAAKLKKRVHKNAGIRIKLKYRNLCLMLLWFCKVEISTKNFKAMPEEFIEVASNTYFQYFPRDIYFDHTPP